MPWTQSMPLDELETALSTTSVAERQQRVAVNNDQPRIIFSAKPAFLVSIDGRPVLSPGGRINVQFPKGAKQNKMHERSTGIPSTKLLNHSTDIGSCEVVAFEQERLTRNASESVSEYVAKIQACGVPPLAEPTVRSSRLGHVLRIDWDHDDLGFVDQDVQFAPTRLAFPGFDDEGGLEQRCR
jgi:hypothetical protein